MMKQVARQKVCVILIVQCAACMLLLHENYIQIEFHNTMQF